MIKVPSNVLSFAQNNTSPYLMFVNYWNHYVHMNGGKEREYQKLGVDGRPLSFSEMENQMNEALRNEVIRISGVSFDSAISPEQWALNPMVSWASFAVVSAMIDMILPDAIFDKVGLFAEIKNGGFGDSFAWDIKPRDLFVVSKGGHAQKSSEVHKQFETTVTVVPEPHQITVQVALYKVLAGKESLAEFTAKAIKSIEASMAADAYTVFATAMGNLTTTGSALMKVVGYTQDAMISLAQRVQAWNGGAKPVLAGTARALRYILPDDGKQNCPLQ
jgi:hypothetical protein